MGYTIAASGGDLDRHRKVAVVQWEEEGALYERPLTGEEAERATFSLLSGERANPLALWRVRVSLEGGEAATTLQAANVAASWPAAWRSWARPIVAAAQEAATLASAAQRRAEGWGSGEAAARKAAALAGPWAAWVAMAPPLGAAPPTPEGWVEVTSAAQRRGRERQRAIACWIRWGRGSPPWADSR